MIKIGITGQAGFIGTHIYNTLGLNPQEYSRIDFKDEYFKDADVLDAFVAQCDVIVHLAAMNRHNDPDVLYATNIGLVEQLIGSLNRTKSRAHLFFSSSTQEERDNLYGKSKKIGREKLQKWAQENGVRFTGLIIPNVYGPFGNPYYNSVIATFCHQLTHNETPKIEVDGDLKLIYVGELVQVILREIDNENGAQIKTIHVPATAEKKVSAILDLLKNYKSQYMDLGILPCLDLEFERNLFTTFLCYMDIETYFPFKLKKNSDHRGSFVETVKLHSGGQISFSDTKPGITRGNHYHTRKAERFAVIKGKAKLELRKIGTDKILTYIIDGEQPAYVDMPIWYTHNITNIGEEDLFTIFWINEHFDASDPDTYFEIV